MANLSDESKEEEKITTSPKVSKPSMSTSMLMSPAAFERPRIHLSANIQEILLLGCHFNNSTRSTLEEQDSSIRKGCKFSPDGTCLLTARANKIDLYNTPYEEETPEHEDKDDGSTNNSTSESSWKPEIVYGTGGSVRAYIWYPHMKSSDPASCCFLGVSRDAPVHLYDAYDGSIRATYRPYNALDEMESPTTLCFAENGQKLVTGGLRTDRILHVFDINRPGREHCEPLLKLGKTRRSKDGQKGLVSALAYSEGNGVIAVGTYSPGSIYLYDLRAYSKSPIAEIVMSSAASASSGGTVCISGHGKNGRQKHKRKRFAMSTNIDDDDESSGHRNIEENNLSSMNFTAAKHQWYQSRTRGGVTQVEFGCDYANHNVGGCYLFSTSRRSNAILQWDLRKVSSTGFSPGIASFETDNATNQRIEFQLHGDQIWTGGKDGCVRVYSHRKSTTSDDQSSLLATIEGFPDSVNGISLYPDDGEVNAIMQSEDQDGDGQIQKLFSPEIKAKIKCLRDNDADIPSKTTKSLFAVAIGARHFPTEYDSENEQPHSPLKTRNNSFASIQAYSIRGP